MSSESPDVVLYDGSSNALAVQNGAAIPVSTPALMLAGSDGTNARYLKVDGTGAAVTNVETSSSTAITNVAASASSVTILSSNTSRLGATIWNDSTTATLYLALTSSSASTSNYTVQLFPSGYYEVPYHYVGQINGIWSAAIGNARVTEMT
jgi:hypothetical protein